MTHLNAQLVARRSGRVEASESKGWLAIRRLAATEIGPRQGSRFPIGSQLEGSTERDKLQMGERCVLVDEMERGGGGERFGRRLRDVKAQKNKRTALARSCGNSSHGSIHSGGSTKVLSSQGTLPRIAVASCKGTRTAAFPLRGDIAPPGRAPSSSDIRCSGRYLKDQRFISDSASRREKGHLRLASCEQFCQIKTK